MSIAIFVAARATVSECAMYLIAFTFDTMLGVAIALGLHTAAVRAARRWTAQESSSPVLVSIAECGSYGEAVRACSSMLEQAMQSIAWLYFQHL